MHMLESCLSGKNPIDIFNSPSEQESNQTPEVSDSPELGGLTHGST